MRAREPENRGADPVRVFLILAAILVAIGAFLWLTRSDPIPDSPANATAPTESPDFSLTDEEAIARFKELDALVIDAYRARDITLLPQIYTTDSPLTRTVRKEIQTLLSNGVLAQSRFSTKRLEVVRNDPRTIVLDHDLIVRPRFVSESGRDLTEGEAELQSVLVTMHLKNSQWLIFDSVITQSRPL